MAYTYDDFLSTANREGLIKQFTDDDLQIAQKNPEFGFSMLSVMKDASRATTTEQKLLANEVANQLRSSYGSFGKAKAEGSFQYENENAYQKALADATEVKDFQYDHTKDPTYSALRQAMLREGERAAANALARASARTGGVPSSYAVTAAQQAQNYYGAQIADMIPELEQNAYQRYLSDIDKKMTELKTLGSDRSDAYTKWLNAQNAEQTDEQQKFANALALYQVLGYATPEIAEILGIPATGQKEEITLPQLPGKLPSGGDVPTGTLTNAQIKELQTFLGVKPDGIWGPLSSNAAGGLSMEQAWVLYQQLLANQKPPEPQAPTAGNAGGAGLLSVADGVNGKLQAHTRQEGAAGGIGENVQQPQQTPIAGNNGMIDGRYPTAPVNKTNTDNRVLVEGKYMTWTEILDGVKNGEIKEQYDPATGRYSYVFVRDKGKGSDGTATTLKNLSAMHTR